MMILLWRLLKTTTFYNIIRRFLNCNNLYVKCGSFNRHFLNRHILHVKYNGFNRHILINLNTKIFLAFKFPLSLKIFPFLSGFFPLFSRSFILISPSQSYLSLLIYFNLSTSPPNILNSLPWHFKRPNV